MKRRTLLDDFADRFPGEPSALIASWSRLGIAASSSSSPPGFVSTGSSMVLGPSDLKEHTRAELARGHNVSLGHGSERSDVDTARLALIYYREHQPRFLFVGLGDTDERAHQDDVPGYWKALRFADDVVGQFRRELALRSGAGATTALFVTTDHGRAENFRDHGRAFPESARSFLLAEIHGPNAPDLGAWHPRYLRDLAPQIRTLCGMNQSGHR